MSASPPQLPTRGAVFLSYASQDAEAVRRICDALRAAGVEVWFDQNELVGGDAWDAKIRQQIAECALFVPIISANTQARLEGYFRIEWKLAARRTHAMATAKAFLLPVVLDATRDAEAHVPEEFRDVQWTRLCGGETGEAFCTRVNKLLGGGALLPPPASTTERGRQPRAAPAVRRRVPAAARFATLAAALVIGGYLALRPARDAGGGSSATAAPLTDAQRMERQVRALVGEKSVAVLPFANQSADSENEYFSDGIADELLTTLQKIPGLKVAARTSAWSFKGKNPTAQEVGAKLGIAHVVEGSVQKSGTKVKITARLSRAATNEETWSKTYGPIELTDVFATQSDIAAAIVGELRGRLTGEAAATAKAEIADQVQAAAKGGTKNPEAHQLYLQGRFYLNQNSRAGYTRAIELFQQATRLEPRFALAWAQLAITQAASTGEGYAESYAVGYSAARQAAQRALELEPDLMEGHVALATIRVSFDWDWAGAKTSSARAIALAPGAADAGGAATWLAIALGDEQQAVALGRRGVDLDPLNAGLRIDLAVAYWISGRLAECETEARRIMELSPTSTWAHFIVVLCLAAEKPDQAEAVNARLTEAAYRLTGLALIRHAQGRKAESDAAVAELEKNHSTVISYQLAEVHAVRGETDRAFAWLENAFALRDTGMTTVKRDPLLRNLHADPRWPAFLKKVGLHDDQLK